MTLKKFVLATLLALSLTACGGARPALKTDMEQKALVGVTEPKALVGVATVRP